MLHLFLSSLNAQTGGNNCTSHAASKHLSSYLVKCNLQRLQEIFNVVIYGKIQAPALCSVSLKPLCNKGPHCRRLRVQ